MSLSKMGCTFFPGMGDHLRRAIIDEIVQNGGDYSSGYFMGNFSDVGRNFNVSGKTVKNIWVNFCESGNVGARDKKGSQNPPHLTEAEFEVIELLKRTVPSMPLKKIQDVIETLQRERRNFAERDQPSHSFQIVVWSNVLEKNVDSSY